MRHLRSVPLLYLLFALAVSSLRAQCPTAAFNLPDSICRGDTLTLTSTSSSNDSLRWSICQPEVSFTASENLGNVGGVMSSVTAVSIPPNNDAFAFIKSTNVHDLYRMDFQPGFAGTPTATSVSITGPQLNSITDADIKFIEHQGQWYGFTTSRTGSKIYRYEFGSNLQSNNITATDLGNPFSAMFAPRDIDVIASGDSIYLAVINVSGILTIYNLGTSPMNAPVWSNNINLGTGVDPISLAVGVDAEIDCDSLFIFVTSRTAIGLKRLSFGTSFLNAPTIETIPNPSNWSETYAPKMVSELGEWRLYVKRRTSSVTATAVGFGNSLSTPVSSLTVTNITDNSSAIPNQALAIAQGDSVTALATNFAGNNLYRFHTGAACDYQITSGTLTDSVVQISLQDTGWNVIQLKACDASGCELRYDSVYVRPGLDAAFQISDLCFGDSTVFSNQSTSQTGASFTSLWEFGDNTSSGLDSVKHVYLTLDTFTAKLTTTLANGCSDSALVSVPLIPLPQVSVANDTVCAGTPVNLNPMVQSQDSIVAYLWDFGNSDTLFDTIPNYEYTQNDTFLLRHVVTSVSGCVGVDSAFMVIKETPLANFEVTNTCEGDTAQFTNLSTSSFTYTTDWDFGDGTVSSEFSPEHAYQDTGTFFVEMLTTSANNCNDTSTVPIRISPIPSFDLSIFPMPLCQNAPFEVTPTITSIDSVIYTEFAMATDTFANPSGPLTTTLTGPVAGWFELAVGTACVADSNFMLNVNRQPQFSFSRSDSCAAQEVIYEADVDPLDSASAASFSWDFGDGNNGSGSTATHIYSSVSTPTVSLIVTSDSGCSNEVLESVDLYAQPEIDLFLSGPFCSDLPVTNNSIITGGDTHQLTSVAWNLIPVGGNTIPFSSADSITPEASGNHILEAIAVNEFGCIRTDSIAFAVAESPIPLIASDSTCVGNAITFGDNYSGSNFLRSWEFGDGGSSNNENPQNIYTDTGSYSVTLMLTDRVTGCMGLDTNFVFIAPTLEASILTDRGCVGSATELVYTSNAEGVNQMQNIQWELEGRIVGISDTASVVIEEGQSGFVQLRGTSSLGCTVVAARTVELIAPPPTDFEFSPGFGIVPFSVEATSLVSGPYTLQWLVDGDSAGSTSVTDLEVSDDGQKELTLVATDSNGCRASKTDIILAYSGIADLAIEQLSVTVADTYNVSFEVRNAGVVPIFGFTYEVRLANGSTIGLSSEQFLIPGEIATIQPSGVTLSNSREPEVTCVEIIALNGLDDALASNNTQCISDESIFTAPYPNPFETSFTVGVNGEVGEEFQVSLVDLTGKVLMDHTYTLDRDNYSEFQITPVDVSAEVYLIVLTKGNETEGFRVIRQRNE